MDARRKILSHFQKVGLFIFVWFAIFDIYDYFNYVLLAYNENPLTALTIFFLLLGIILYRYVK